MAGCREILRRIEMTDGGYDQETLRHCLKCETCRRELYCQIAATGSEVPAVPELLDLRLRILCRGGRQKRNRYRLSNVILWAGTAMVLLLCVWSFYTLSCPRIVTMPIAVTVEDPEWDGSLLLNRLADIGAELSITKKLIQADQDETEIFM